MEARVNYLSHICESDKHEFIEVESSYISTGSEVTRQKFTQCRLCGCIQLPDSATSAPLTLQEGITGEEEIVDKGNIYDLIRVLKNTADTVLWTPKEVIEIISEYEPLNTKFKEEGEDVRKEAIELRAQLGLLVSLRAKLGREEILHENKWITIDEMREIVSGKLQLLK